MLSSEHNVAGSHRVRLNADCFIIVSPWLIVTDGDRKKNFPTMLAYNRSLADKLINYKKI